MLRKIARAKGIKLTIIVDLIHVIEYLWEAGRAFHPESGPELEKDGLPIATGVIEGACRHLVKDRMEITGAKWRLQGEEFSPCIVSPSRSATN